jgi:hypothetical protein
MAGLPQYCFKDTANQNPRGLGSAERNIKPDSEIRIRFEPVGHQSGAGSHVSGAGEGMGHCHLKQPESFQACRLSFERLVESENGCIPL